MEFNLLFSNIYSGFIDIYEVLRSDLSLLWLLIPIIILWTATEIYYGEYSRETFGFSSAFTGALSLLWLCFITLRGIFAGGIIQQIRANNFVLLIVAFFVIYGLSVLYVSFRHTFREKMLSIFASPRILYFFSFILVFLGASRISADFYFIFDIFLVFSLFSLFFTIIKKYWLAGFLGEVEAVKNVGVKSDIK